MDLKGNTKGKKPTHVAGGIVKISKELINLHKYVFMTSDILFVNGITFFYFSESSDYDPFIRQNIYYCI